MVDAGANIGTDALLLARLVGSIGTVVATEPDTIAAQRLAENVDLNNLDGVGSVERAVKRMDGTVR